MWLFILAISAFTRGVYVPGKLAVSAVLYLAQ